MTDRRKCTATNRDGVTPCSADARPGSRYCTWHDPALAEQRAQWSREGGRAKSNQRRARKELALAADGVAQLPAVLFRALGRVEAGDLEPAVANSMATIARAIVTVQQAHELEERLSSLEARAGIGRVPA
jgi:hypothetical protein